MPVSVNATAEKLFTIIAVKGNTTSIDVTFTLDDFHALQEYKKYVESGVIQTSSYIEDKGVSEDVELSNVKLSMDYNKTKKIVALKNISNKKYQELQQLNFMQFIIDELVENKTCKVG